MKNTKKPKNKRVSPFTYLSLRDPDIKTVDKFQKSARLPNRTEAVRQLIRLGVEYYETQQAFLKEHFTFGKSQQANITNVTI
jgi:hypothetical protein